MLKLKEATDVGRSLLTARRLVVAGAAALGLYNFGDDGLSYLSTATRLVSDGVGDQIPIQFELERAKTMIDSIVPDIKRNMIVIAKEEVDVETIRDEVQEGTATLAKQKEELLTLREQAQHGTQQFKIGSRIATEDEVKVELKRMLVRYQLAETTLGAKQDLLFSRESSLDSARRKLESMLNAKRDLEVQVENLQARVRSVESEAVASSIDFDETHVAKCQKLVDDLRVRLKVAEKLVATNGSIEDFATTITIGDEDVFTQIDEHLASSAGKDFAQGG